MKRVLFVDDEEKILSGLRRMLRGQRREWEMVFLNGGQEALDAMAASPFDVVVTDMRMPGMDGATLLARVEENHPSTVRIVLSGHSELEAAMRAVPVAHQFLTKPCDADVLRTVIRRACDLQQLLDSPVLQETIGSVEALPVLPRVYNELTAALVDPEVELPTIARIVEQDMGITAKILQLVNSSFFGVAKTIDGIGQAIAYLGTSMLQNLVLSMEVFRSFENRQMPPSFSMEAEQAHAILAARIARHLLEEKAAREQAFLAAMLHDIGKLILAACLPETFARIREAQEGTDRPFWTVEEECHGVSHAELGAYLLGIWGMPYPIVEAVANHHRPSRVEHSEFGVLGATHVANGLARDVVEAPEAPPQAPSARIDMDYLRSVGVSDRLADWRETAVVEAGAGQKDAA